jgi:methionyl-tRNA formyltransferase
VIQPNRLREPAAWEQLQAWEPDIIIVAAFGQILRQNVLDLPQFGCINVHASLLPRWRGASPIVASILHGDSQTGVTIMKMDAGVDSGAILAQQATPIQSEDTTPVLEVRLAQMGAELLIQTLPGYLNGSILPCQQDEALITKAPMISKEDGLLNLALPAATLERQVRAFTPWPGTYIILDGAVFKILRAHAVNQMAYPGERGAINGFPSLRTTEGWLVLDEVQPAGKKAMPGDVFLRGARGWLDRKV